jgi:hypothetical protein
MVSLNSQSRIVLKTREGSEAAIALKVSGFYSSSGKFDARRVCPQVVDPIKCALDSDGQVHASREWFALLAESISR